MPDRDEPRRDGRLELPQGTLDILILQTLRWGPQHGYGIIQMIRANSNNLLQLETGSVYPALHRLERRKWIAAGWKTSQNNQRVREYRLTATGKKQLVEERSRWEQLTQAVASILGRTAPEGGV